MNDPGRWKTTRISQFIALVAEDYAARERTLIIHTPDGAALELVFAADEARTIGRLLAPPAWPPHRFPPEQ